MNIRFHLDRRRRFRRSGMTLIEVTLALGLTLVIIYAATVQLRIQEEIWWQMRRMEFYTREMPRIARGLHTLAMKGQSFQVTDLHTIVVDVRNPNGTTSPNKIYYDPTTRTIRYFNANDNWYIAQNVKNCVFAMNHDSTVSVFIDNGHGVFGEFVIERM